MTAAEDVHPVAGAVAVAALGPCRVRVGEGSEVHHDRAGTLPDRPAHRFGVLDVAAQCVPSGDEPRDPRSAEERGADAQQDRTRPEHGTGPTVLDLYLHPIAAPEAAHSPDQRDHPRRQAGLRPSESGTRCTDGGTFARKTAPNAQSERQAARIRQHTRCRG
jgi:hypothetical protein